MFYCCFRVPTLSLVVEVKGGVYTIQPYASKVIQSVFVVESMKHAVRTENYRHALCKKITKNWKEI